MSNKEIDEAIRVNKILESNPFDVKWKKSIQLGIEALERLKETRDSNPEAMPKVAYHSYLQLLPSETEAKSTT